MEKTVLTPEESRFLIPHWYELDDEKLKKLNFVKTRKSNFLGKENYRVMSTTGILVTPIEIKGKDFLYILNGKHRAFVSARSGLNLEAYVVSDEHDILYHTPRKSFGSEDPEKLILSDTLIYNIDNKNLNLSDGLKSVLNAYVNMNKYIDKCRENNICFIKDFFKNNDKFIY
ncbi:MAG: hypothetical protein PHV16_01635 [Candidatus Nanoarchaeia archaeon]|nr:hypothetical protein [Candidatus Nanoarchaeia archaeon]